MIHKIRSKNTTPASAGVFMLKDVKMLLVVLNCYYSKNLAPWASVLHCKFLKKQKQLRRYAVISVIGYFIDRT